MGKTGKILLSVSVILIAVFMILVSIFLSIFIFVKIADHFYTEESEILGEQSDTDDGKVSSDQGKMDGLTDSDVKDPDIKDDSSSSEPDNENTQDTSGDSSESDENSNDSNGNDTENGKDDGSDTSDTDGGSSENEDTKEDHGNGDHSSGENADGNTSEDGESSGDDENKGETEDLSFTVTYISGTKNAYTVKDGVLTFTSIHDDSVYSISGRLDGNIVIDVGDDHKFDLELHGFTLNSNIESPIVILSGDEVSINAKNGYENFIYDKRAALDGGSEDVYSAAIYSAVDLKICGKGKLTLVSDNNNGIHTKDDLEVKNLTLYVKCKDNALKGNDSVTLEMADTTLIATVGDCIKTSNSDISDKGNQRGTVTVLGGTHLLYAACDAIDAAYDVAIKYDFTKITIFTDKNSEYSEKVTAVSDDVYYIRFASNSYKYSVKYSNSENDYLWADAVYHSSVFAGRSTYYYYSFPRKSDYSMMQIYIYASTHESSQDESYLGYTDYISPNTAYDTVAFTSRGNSISYSWTNYTTSISPGMGFPGGGGGMNEGNADKGDYSTKGIKAANSINISGGNINITSYDDAIHANGGEALENGETGSGNITISGGNITVSSSDDGVHADGTLTVSGGDLNVIKSYEGLEGLYVIFSGGNVYVNSTDDGINATSSTGASLNVIDGTLYINAGGDGIDSNSRTSYGAIVFSGGSTVIFSTSGGNSAIDSEGGYKYTGGSVLAVMPSNAMVSESKKCADFSAIATSKSISLSTGEYLTVSVGGTKEIVVKIPKSIFATAIYLGSNSASISTSSEISEKLNENGVYFK